MKKMKKSKEIIDKKDVILKTTMNNILKDFGKNSIKFASELQPKYKNITGIKEIDDLIGGGFISENINIIYGETSSGKSSTALHVIKEAQAKNKRCCFVDLEHKFDPKRAKDFGVDLSKLLFVDELNNAEEAMDIIIRLSKKKIVDIAIVDSIQAFSVKGEQETKKKKEKSVEDDTQALLPRKIGQFIRMTKDHIKNAKICLILIGQVRATIGYGGDVLTGGNALKHFNVLTLKMRRGKQSEAPYEPFREDYVDENGKSRYRTLKKICGFDCVLKLEKAHVYEAQPEGTELHLPFYFKSGFINKNMFDK